jgi:hypothetical protein
MAIYTKIKRGDGVIRYRNKTTSKFVSVKDLPANIVEMLEKRDWVDDEQLPKAPLFKKCLFCNNHSPFNKFVSLQTVYLCKEHYYSENTGKIVQKLRENKYGEKEETR